jgi:2,4-dienoyl-CoA reductase-like NADH-dependent reductase (Old Yellow Enzyme family)
VSASAVPVSDGSLVFTEAGEACPFPTPRALQLEEIPGLVQQFADAASNAIASGFHGVEVRLGVLLLWQWLWGAVHDISPVASRCSIGTADQLAAARLCSALCGYVGTG